MRLTELTFLNLYLISIIDADLHRDISLKDVKDKIERGDIFDWLGKKFEGNIDLSIFDGSLKEEIIKGWRDILGGYGGRERRKFGIENSGICLLASWTNELIQRKTWTS